MNLFKKTSLKIADLKLSKKFIITFSSILIINLMAGYYFSDKIRSLKNLVETVYDNPLMASTYAMSAKYRFEKIDSYVRTAIYTTNADEMKNLTKEIRSELEQGREDLDVVKERALAESSKNLADEVEENLSLYESEINSTLEKSKATNSKSINISESLKNSENWLNLKARTVIQQKLTNLTDDAAETGYFFRLDSEAKNKETVIVFYVLSGTLLFITMLFALFLTRTIARPILKYADACKEISKNNYSKRLDVFGEKSEIAVLGTSFNHMLNKIEQKDHNMQSLLGGIPNAVFFFDQQGVISDEKSRATFRIFPDINQHSDIQSFFKKYSDFSEDNIKNAVSFFWDNSHELDFESIADLLPQKLEVANTDGLQYLQMNYQSEKNQNGHLSRIIVIGTDKTTEVLTALDSKNKEERVQRISLVGQNISDYLQVVDDLDELWQDIFTELGSAQALDLTKLKRNLHTIKGGLAGYEYTTLAEKINDVETLLNTNDVKNILEQLKAQLNQIKNNFDELHNEVKSIFGLTNDNRAISVNIEKFNSLKNQILQSSKAELIESISQCEKMPLDILLTKYKKYISRLVENSQSKLAEIKIDPLSSEIRPLHLSNLAGCLGHLLRNCFDHGIEDAETREALGKNIEGTISIFAVEQKSGSLILKIKDDGNGIDFEKLADKAVKTGLWTADKKISSDVAEKINLIFESGLSSAEVVSETSGRGVGMDAVKSDITARGGRIEVLTAKGLGTEFIIHMPNF